MTAELSQFLLAGERFLQTLDQFNHADVTKVISRDR
jgi:hypothetical protein